MEPTQSRALGRHLALASTQKNTSIGQVELKTPKLNDKGAFIADARREKMRSVVFFFTQATKDLGLLGYNNKIICCNI